jgi:hypothetical protein
MMMNTIYADFNAMTERSHVRLTTRGSQADLERFAIPPGDWVWLTDGELVVGALVSIDSYYGVVGVPDWDTLAHLDDEGADDCEHIKGELDPLLAKEVTSEEEEQRIFELLVQLDFASHRQFRDVAPGSLAFRRAVALRRMGKLDLAMLEINEARQAQPDDPTVSSAYLDLVSRQARSSAAREAESIAETPDLATPVRSV